MLKRYEDEGRPDADQPLLAWAFHDACGTRSRWRSTACCATSRCVRSAGCCGPGVPVGPPRSAAVGSPRPSRRRAADGAERSARPPGRRACYLTPAREQPRRAHERAAARRDRGRAGGAQVPQGAQGWPAQGARRTTSSWPKPKSRARSTPPSANCSSACATATSSSSRSTTSTQPILRRVDDRRRRFDQWRKPATVVVSGEVLVRGAAGHFISRARAARTAMRISRRRSFRHRPGRATSCFRDGFDPQ